MDFNEYQDLTRRTAGSSPDKAEIDRLLKLIDDNGFEKADYFKRVIANVRLLGNVIGVSGEGGEVADYLKKVVFHGHPFESEKLTKELGDVLWYVARCADVLGIKMEDVAAGNIEKLKARYPNGFSSERSINKTE